MTTRSQIPDLLIVAGLGLGALVICGQVLDGLGRWGSWDWEYFYFQALSNHRTVAEFGEVPLWNPWYRGGIPIFGNIQSEFPSPWFALGLAVGPIPALKFQIVAHYLIAVASMYWMARVFGLSRLASAFASGTFVYSSWMALRVHSGHLTYLSTAYTPLLIGLWHIAARHRSAPILAGLVAALMLMEGGVYDLIYAFFLIAVLALVRAIAQRTPRPLLCLALIGAWAVGFGAIKLVPVFEYMADNPRVATIYEKPRQTLDRYAGGEVTSSDPTLRGAGDLEFPVVYPRTKWDLPKLLLKVFFGHDQRSNTRYYALMSYSWHEYGAYLGPLGAVLALAALVLAGRTSGPWLVAAFACLLMAAGNVAPFAPWSLMHRLPVLRSMHAPSRFFTPMLLCLAVAGGYGLDRIVARLSPGRLAGAPRQWPGILAVLLVLASLTDAVFVARHSIRGVFDATPPGPPPSQRPILTTLDATIRLPTTVYANYCKAMGYEPSEPPVNVKAREQPDYRGEAHYEPRDGGGWAPVEIAAWSPNAQTLRVEAPAPGFVVVNRNWRQGWRAESPYGARMGDGLVVVPVEPGRHVIRLRFVPRGVLIGTGISLVSLACAGAWLALGRRRGPRPAAPVGQEADPVGRHEAGPPAA